MRRETEFSDGAIGFHPGDIAERLAERNAQLAEQHDGEAAVDLSSLQPGARFLRRSDGAAARVSRLTGPVVFFACSRRNRIIPIGAAAFLNEYALEKK